jgi:2Fe-2S type ferredoxin
MTESIEFHTDLYRRDALERVAADYRDRADIDLADRGAHVEARLVVAADADAARLRDEFCTAAFSATARTFRDLAAQASAAPVAVSDRPPWELLAPFHPGSPLGLGWVLESLTPIRSGAASMTLRHPQHGVAHVAVHRNSGAPLGVAHTDQLDFLLMNGGRGTTATQASIGAVLIRLAEIVRTSGTGSADPALLAALLPHREGGAHAAAGASPTPDGSGSRRVAPTIDLNDQTIALELDETGISRLALYDTLMAFAPRCYLSLTRPDATHIGIRVKPRDPASTDVLRGLTRDVVKAINQLLRSAVAGGTPAEAEGNGGLPPLRRPPVDLPALVAELAAADPATLGLGFEPERGPGHENLRIMTILGTGACNSDCLFCCEKFNPGNRLMPSTDATRKVILDGSGQYDMLFFASGEPTIHPKLFEHVELAKQVGFTRFGMSSHFRTLADPAFALRILQAGFEYFDISLHAADRDGQLAVNPIDDGGASLFEALKGLAVLYRLADALGIRISVTQKIVVSRLNVTNLEAIFRATYDRGVRNFILQPVRALGLAPERQAALAMSEDDMLPYVNELLRNTEGLGAVIKPYGFSRQALLVGSHVQHEQNRIKNVMGKHKSPRGRMQLPPVQEARPTDGRFWVEVRTHFDQQFAFAADGGAPLLDQALKRGAHLPFGCRMGSCGMCCARLLSGTVDQSTQIFLTDEQQAQGFVLLCQARPQSDVTVVMCTDDEIDPL